MKKFDIVLYLLLLCTVVVIVAKSQIASWYHPLSTRDAFLLLSPYYVVMGLIFFIILYRIFRGL